MDLLNAIIKPQSRRIGFLIPDVIITETHTDELNIAQHPVDRSASISDYAWKKAASLKINCGFSGHWAQVDFSLDGSWGYFQPLD